LSVGEALGVDIGGLKLSFSNYGKPIDPGPPETLENPENLENLENLENPENLQDLHFEILCPTYKLLSWAQCSHYFRWRPSKFTVQL
jgi:hypothetical protein